MCVLVKLSHFSLWLWQKLKKETWQTIKRKRTNGKFFVCGKAEFLLVAACFSSPANGGKLINWKAYLSHCPPVAVMMYYTLICDPNLEGFYFTQLQMIEMYAKSNFREIIGLLDAYMTNYSNSLVFIAEIVLLEVSNGCKVWKKSRPKHSCVKSFIELCFCCVFSSVRSFWQI